ncbi:MAG TPA: thioredoxin domain-containing protein [Terriglobales bacterium]|nr:thioredoxin domain-containing protein [Terriglobales bacterium]
MTLVRRSILVLLLICLGCSAQSAPPDVAARVEKQVRYTYNIPSEVKITLGPLRPSDFANYDLVTVSLAGGSRKQDVDFLLAKDGKTLVRFTKLDLTKDPYAEIMKKITVAGRPTRGNKDAKVVAVNFDDFECPFCSRMHQTLFPELLKEYGDRVLFIYKDYPLSQIHPWATHAAVNANCLAAQSTDAYWDFADYIHANQKDVNSEKKGDPQFAVLDKITLQQGQKHSLDAAKLEACIKAQNEDAVKASVKEGEALGIDATPTMYVNGQKVDGALPIDEVRAILDSALTQAGVPVPAHPAPAPSSEGTPTKPSGK